MMTPLIYIIKLEIKIQIIVYQTFVIIITNNVFFMLN